MSPSRQYPIPEIDVAWFANYSSRGVSEVSQRSQRQAANLKRGTEFTINSIFRHFTGEALELLQPFFDQDTTLVPIPRSSLLVGEDATWPGRTIAHLFVNAGFGQQVINCLHRQTAIRKSSLISSADERPSVDEHYQSLKVDPEIISTPKITLIDDVLTLGRTSFAAAARMKEAFPEKEIRAFAVMRTRGIGNSEIERVVDPRVAKLIFNSTSRKTRIENESPALF